MSFKLLLSFLITFFISMPSWATTSTWRQDEHVSVRLISAHSAVGDKKEVLLGLEVNLAPNVHTYWRSPGLAGTPPSFEWHGSHNIKESTILYPAPIRFGVSPFDSVGYQGKIIFPLRFTLENPGQALGIKARLNLLVCKTICLPKSFELSLLLPTGEAKETQEYELIEDALNKVPKNTADDSLRIKQVEKLEDTITLFIASDKKLHTPDLFIETEKDILFQAPEITISTNKHHATININYESDEPFQLKDLTATIVDAPFATTRNLHLAQQTNVIPFWCILLLALLGGFILNLMPCVLPVLSLKIFSLIRHKQEPKAVIRRAFLSTASGIIFSFIVLAGAMISLKASGQAIGWGVHFQQPIFLTFMIVVLTFFAANLWGFYEVGMPRIIQRMVDPKKHPKLSGDFANGALATMLATPCSAPFLGTAISFALAAGWLEIISVFIALGLGMALPYLLIAARPRIAQFFPTPGPWMQTLSRVLGFGLAGTAVWLLIVLKAQIGGFGTITISGAMVVMLVMMILRHRKVTPLITYPAFTAILVTVFGLALVATTPEHVARKSGLWQPLNEEAIEQNVREGKTVFVDITADWCLTCKMNKRFSLANDEVTKKLFHNKNVISMQGDWTNPDPVITAFLHKYGRYGVPFNIIFSATHPNGLVLPEILTPSIVLKALNNKVK